MPVNFFKLDNIRTHSSSLKFIRFIPLKMINSTGLVKRQQNLDLPGFKNLEGLPIARSRTAVIETCV
ncbi:MAG: hypothetical protein WC504_17175, partial [Methylobacter sp.]